MQTQIILSGNVQLDLYDDIDISLNYSISDIREIDKINTNFSYDIKLPGTPNNNRVFGHIYELGNDNIIFNPNKKVAGQIYVEGNQVFKGFVQLKKINRLYENEIEYEITFMGSLGDLMSAIGDDKFLDDIDFSEYNHDYTKQSITGSWATNIYSYSSSTSFALGKGYVYPQIFYGYDTNGKYDVEDWYPAMYAKEYLDRIFAGAGYSYKSEFFNSQYFRSLIVPFNKDRIMLTDAQLKQRMFYANRTSAFFDFWRSGMSNTGYPMRLGFNNDSVAPAFDTNNVYPVNSLNDANQTIRGRYYPNKKGRYNIRAAGSINIQYDLQSTVPVQAYTIPQDSWMRPIVYVKLMKNGVNQYQQQLSFTQPSGAFVGTSMSPPETFDISFDLNLVPGDYVNIDIDFYVPMAGSYTSNAYSVAFGTPLPSQLRVRVDSGAYFYNTPYNDGLTESEHLYVNQTLPDNVKQKDYVTSLINMFNLLVLPDPDKDKQLIIEPRDDFFDSGGERKNWSDKLDRAKQYQLLPMSELENKTYVYSYSSDSDAYNDKYFKEYGENVYGDLIKTIDNDFLDGESKTQLIFSPTPNVRDFVNAARSVPMFITLDSAGVPKPHKGNIRLLFYGGLKTGSYTFASTATGTQVYTTYPYAGMLDDPNNPTESLVFGEPKVSYFPQTTWTDNNLFNKYHRTTFEEISNKNSKILVGQFYLTPSDIAKLDFRDRIEVDGQLFRINKVENYNPAVNTTTKVELLSLNDYGRFIATAKPTLRGPIIGTGTVGVGNVGNVTADTSTNRVINSPGNIGPIYVDTGTLQPNGNLNSSQGGSNVLGTDNIVAGGTGVLVNGSGNTVGTEVQSSLIIGDMNSVGSSYDNVVILGSEGREINESNIIYLGNEFVIRSGSTMIALINIYEGGLNEVQNPFNVFQTTDILDGGENAVRQRGSVNTIFVVDGGANKANPS